jgi:hypothetical protein
MCVHVHVHLSFPMSFVDILALFVLTRALVLRSRYAYCQMNPSSMASARNSALDMDSVRCRVLVPLVVLPRANHRSALIPWRVLRVVSKMVGPVSHAQHRCCV